MSIKICISFVIAIVVITCTIGVDAMPDPLSMRFRENSDGGDDTTKFMAGAKKMVMYFIDHLSIQKTYVGSSGCELCKAIVVVLKNIVNSNMTNDEAVMFVTGLCVSLGIEAEEVCYYALVNMLPEVMDVNRLIGDSISNDNVCAFMEGGSCIDLDEYLPVFDWNLTFPSPEPPYVLPPQPSPLAPKLRILHISDTHYDEHYLEGTIVNCNEPLCCRANKVSSESEVYYAGKYGGINGDCDIPRLTVESMLNFITENLQVDLIYWTGDIPPHDVWNQTKEGNVNRIKINCALIRQYFPEDNTVFASVGNHESEPVNSYPVPAAYDEYDISYLYTGLDSVWTTFLPNIDHSTVLKGGYYAYDVKPGLRVISLNMNYCHSENWWLLIQSQDPTEQYQWLVNQLDHAEKNNIKVHILGHQPPGNCLYVCSRNYRDILDRYKGTIAGHFYGHTHHDEFQMIYDDEDTTVPISVAQIGPSVTTASRINPAFRIYTVDGDYTGTTWQVLDYETYWLDVNSANLAGFATWELLYTAKSAYGLADMTPASFNDFISRMETDDALFQTFYQNYYRVFTNEPCDGDCKTGMLCDLRKGWAGYNSTQCS